MGNGFFTLNMAELAPSKIPFGSEAFKSFQLESLTIQQKSDWNYGKQIAVYVESTVNGGTAGYFWMRNQRWKINRNYANGKISMQRFMDTLQFNGKQNYININWQCIQIVNRIVSGLVGRWMNRNEKIVVTATDSLSEKQKQEEYDQLEFYIENRDQLQKLQEASGVQVMPQDESLPTDKDQLFLWKKQLQRLPEEIATEMGCNDILAACGWFDVLKEKSLHDCAVTGFAGTYTWMDSDGVIHVDWLKPENCFYSYSNFPDFRDTTWRGHMTTMKISEVRRKYGVQFGGKLTEENLFKMAQTAKDYQVYDNIQWMTEWNFTFLRPYDEWNVSVMEFEVKTVDSESYTITTTKKNRSTIIRKGVPEKKDENTDVVEDTKINIYRGVYERNTQTMLEWGLKKNMIRPQDPKEIGNAEFSYSFYMAQSYDMTSLGVPEKIQEPVDQMIIARLKMQQLVAKMRPAGSAINWDALQNIDYGLGAGNKTIDVKKHYDQTGDIYYRGRDAEGNAIPVPIVELQNSGFLSQLQGLILIYDKNYQIVKDELGEDPNLITQAAQPRVAVSNIDTAQQQAAFATDYFYNAYVSVMQQSATKISCLIKTSVTYGSQAYRKILKEDDVDGRIFGTKIQLLPDEIEIAKFEAMMNNALSVNQDLVLFINPFQLSRVAKEDAKLAEELFRQGQKRMLQWQQATAQQNQQATIQGQVQSAQAAEQSKQETEKIKGDIDIQKVKMQEEASVKNALSVMFTSMLKEGGVIPANMMPVFNAWVENTVIPMVAENEEQKAALIGQTQQAQQVAQQPQPQEQEPPQQMQQEQSQTQPQLAA